MWVIAKWRCGLSGLSPEFPGLIASGVLGAALLGSAHCAGMCGPLVMASARTRRDWAQYQIGRLAGYLGLGALAGGLGSTVGWTSKASAIPHGFSQVISWLSTLLLALAFTQMALSLWRGRRLHFQIVPARVLARLHSLSGGRPWAIGVLSALLPCGWLQGFVLAAVTTGSILRGGLMLTLFWLGTLPALVAGPALLHRLSRRLGTKRSRVAALLMIASALLVVGARARMGQAKPEASAHAESSRGHSCH
jgi:sulfite exporter TauE/SafE